MYGKIDRSGICNLQWDLRQEKFYSPNGMQQCLPCEGCGQPQWVSLSTCSVLCEFCVKMAEGDPLDKLRGDREHCG